jgi:hypothetical protein
MTLGLAPLQQRAKARRQSEMREDRMVRVMLGLFMLFTNLGRIKNQEFEKVWLGTVSPILKAKDSSKIPNYENFIPFAPHMPFVGIPRTFFDLGEKLARH